MYLEAGADNPLPTEIIPLKAGKNRGKDGNLSWLNLRLGLGACWWSTRIIPQLPGKSRWDVCGIPVWKKHFST